MSKLKQIQIPLNSMWRNHFRNRKTRYWRNLYSKTWATMQA